MRDVCTGDSADGIALAPRLLAVKAMTMMTLRIVFVTRSLPHSFSFFSLDFIVCVHSSGMLRLRMAVG